MLLHALRSGFIALALVGPSTVGDAMSGEVPDAPQLVPLSADGEEVADDPEFTAECMKHLAGIADRLKWELGPPLLTRSGAFGLVLRFDAKTPQAPDMSPFITRVVCWKISGTDQFNIQIAVTDEPPLPAPQR